MRCYAICIPFAAYAAAQKGQRSEELRPLGRSGLHSLCLSRTFQIQTHTDDLLMVRGCSPLNVDYRLPVFTSVLLAITLEIREH